LPIVLPACNQYERWENTLFNFEYPHNVFQLRPPLFAPLEGTLPEPEIYTRLLRAMNLLPPEARLAELRAVALQDRAAFGKALGEFMSEAPHYRHLGPIILYETLGKALPEGAAAAAVWWPAAHQCVRQNAKAVMGAGFSGEGFAVGEALFEAMMTRPSGVVFTHERHEDLWRLVRTEESKVQLAVPEMMEWLARLDVRDAAPNPDYPIMLLAGQRRHYNANQAIRDPRWRKKDPAGALHLHPDDLAETGGSAGGWMAVVTPAGRLVVRVESDERLRRSQASLPHGFGQIYDRPEGKVTIGPRLNMITMTDDCDPIARTPYHKNVAIRVELPSASEIEHHEEQEIWSRQVAG
jgi:anaerobic selenocysteine-containing dehydrogenase